MREVAMRHPRSALGHEALAWIGALEALTASRGLRTDDHPAGEGKGLTVSELCEGLGCMLVFYGRARAKAHPEADGLLMHVLPIMALLELSLDDVRNLRPAGVA